MKAATHNRRNLLQIGIVVSGILLIIMPAMIGWIGSGANPQPGYLVATETKIEWGDMYWNKKADSKPLRNPQFLLWNRGGTPVRIKSVKATCGCASANVDPNWVPPGERSIVNVEVTPPDLGVKDVKIIVDTDSPKSPEVNLELLVLGGRKPPYLLSIRGEIYFQPGYGIFDKREFVIDSVEESKSIPHAPNPECDLSFMKSEMTGISEKSFIGGRGFIVRSYRYQIGFNSKPPCESFTARITAVDPWNPSNRLPLNIRAEENLPFRVAPSTLILEYSGDDDESSSLKFFAKCVLHEHDLVIEADGPIQVDKIDRHPVNGFSLFKLSWKKGISFKEGLYHVILRVKDGPADLFTSVPVHVKSRRTIQENRGRS